MRVSRMQFSRMGVDDEKADHTISQPRGGKDNHYLCLTCKSVLGQMLGLIHHEKTTA